VGIPLTLDQLPDDNAALKALLVAKHAELAAVIVTQLMIDKLKEIARLRHMWWRKAKYPPWPKYGGDVMMAAHSIPPRRVCGEHPQDRAN
jgi:hypothetical protein